MTPPRLPISSAPRPARGAGRPVPCARARRASRARRSGGRSERRGADADALAVSPEVGAHASSTGARDQEQARAGDGAMRSPALEAGAAWALPARADRGDPEARGDGGCAALYSGLCSGRFAEPCPSRRRFIAGLRAPALAERAGSVRFRSSFSIRVGSDQFPRYTESGVISFATSEYETELALGKHGPHVQRKFRNGLLYAREVQTHSRVAPTPWLAYRVGPVVQLSDHSLIDPQVIFALMAGSSGTPDVVNHEFVGTVHTTHYRVSTSLHALLSAESEPATLTRSLEDAPGTLDVWVDNAGRPLRVEARFLRRAELRSREMRIAVRLDDYGRPARPSFRQCVPSCRTAQGAAHARRPAVWRPVSRL